MPKICPGVNFQDEFRAFFLTNSDEWCKMLLGRVYFFVEFADKYYERLS